MAVKRYTGNHQGASVFSPNGTILGQYPLLSQALASITGATSQNRFQIWVTGSITETVEILLVSHVDLHFLGGSRLINGNDDNTVTMRCAGAVDLAVYDATWIRNGAVTGTNAPICGVVSGVSDDTTQFYNTRWLNRVTKGAGSTNGVNCHGLYQANASAARLTACEANGAGADHDSHGLVCDGTSIGLHKNCAFRGGTGGDNSYGGRLTADHTGNYIDCDFSGGANGNLCYGIYTDERAIPEFIGGISKGGAGTTFQNCHGFVSDGASNPKCFRMKIEGGDCLNTSSGLVAQGTSTFQGDCCTFAGGRSSFLRPRASTTRSGSTR